MKRPGQSRIWVAIAAIGCAAFVGVQFIRPTMNHPPTTGDLKAPAEVAQILRRSCYDCHSDETKLAWFDQIVPAYWLVARDVTAGRSRLNFSELGSFPSAQQNAALYEAVNQIQLGAMPLPAYLHLHHNAVVTASQLAILKNYLNPAPAVGAAPTSDLSADEKQYKEWITQNGQKHAVSRAANGIEFMPEYKNWKAISTTDRLDNQTLRVILGNDTATKAIAENRTNPWPNGTAFAKVAWAQREDGQGHVRSGAFVQVEFMIRDSTKYAPTRGWGWARWRGAGLTPYGRDATFTDECIGCHTPVRNNDYVFTIPTPRQYNGTVPWNPSEQLVITSSVDRQSSTMSTFYGNDLAVQYSRTNIRSHYPPGSALALVTWTQREDPHWFGAKIPGQVKSIEFVKVSRGQDGNEASIYENYEGSPLGRKSATDGNSASNRIADLLSLHAAVMP